jgi:transposase
MVRKLDEAAFEHYVALGVGRSYRAVAREFKVSTRTVAKCASRENWQERLAELTRQAKLNSDQRLIGLLVERNQALARILERQRAALAALEELPMQSAAEAAVVLQRGILLERRLQGLDGEGSAA